MLFLVRSCMYEMAKFFLDHMRGYPDYKGLLFSKSVDAFCDILEKKGKIILQGCTDTGKGKTNLFFIIFQTVPSKLIKWLELDWTIGPYYSSYKTLQQQETILAKDLSL